MNKLFIMFLLLLLFNGCKNNENKKTEIINFSQPSTSPLRFSEVIEKQRFIKLETTTESLLGVINKISISDNLIFIKSNGAIYIFKSNGKFVRKINNKGVGPNEYIRLSDFDIDYEEEELIIFDKGKKQILYYDFLGNYIRSTSLDFWAIKLKKISEEKILLFSGNELTSKEQNYKFTLLTKHGNNQSFHVIDKNKSRYLHVINNQNFYENKSKCYFYEVFNDTVYMFDKDLKLTPKYLFSYDNKNIPSSFFEKPYSNIMEFFQKYNKTDYAYGISLFMETNQNIFTVYYVGSKPCYAIYNKKNKKARSFRAIQDDVSFNKVLLPPLNEDFRIWTFGDDLIYFLEPNWLAERKSQIRSSHLNDLSKEIDENDNPIMVISSVQK